MKYCTYLTFYSGNKLPPYYIGSTSIFKIQKGYRGSVISYKYKSIWNSELKHNPHLFKTTILTVHADRQGAFDKELFFQESLRVVTSPLYINMAYARKNGHFGYGEKGRPKSEEHRKKISESKKGNQYWVGRQHSEESKKKISDYNMGKKMPKETILKMVETRKRNNYITSDETKLKHSIAKKRKLKSEETKQKMSLAKKGKPHSEEAKHNRRGKGCGERNAMAVAENRMKVSLSKIGRKKMYREDGTSYMGYPDKKE